jgi:putative flippase GtrA
VIAPAHPPTQRTAHPLVAAFVRFVVCGGGVGLASSGALVLLGAWIPLLLANALITVVSTVIATELHSRISFRSGRRGWRVHLQSGLTVVVSYAFTSGALLVLHAVQSSPSALVEQTVYLSASAAAGVGRFALLRLVVFAQPMPRVRPSPPASCDTVLTRPAVAIAA